METRKEYAQKRLNSLLTERSSFDAHWREIAEFIQPRQGRFFITDVNKGDRRHKSIINSTGTKAHEVAQAGLHAGVMSPARPWFALSTATPDLMESQAVKLWLELVEKLLTTIFSKSNLYNMAPVMFGELLNFGTGAMMHLDDYDTVARFYTLTVGSYALAQNDKFEIDTLVRKYQMTTRQMVARFKGNVSHHVQNSYDRGNYDARWDVGHLIEPNGMYEPDSEVSSKLRFSSCYFEMNADKDGLLEEKGFYEFPAHCPRWFVAGEDVYATNCPGMTALGDIKGLQIAERRLANAIDKQVNPPLRGPSSLRGATIQSIPGGITLYDETVGGKLESIYSVAPNVMDLSRNIERHEMRIKRAFYEDLFLSMISLPGVQPQNEVFLNQQRQEALLQLGPMLERVHNEALTKIIDRTFNQCARAGILPPAPPELQGQPLQVNYTSALAMAMKSVATNGIDRLTTYIGGLASIGYGQITDKFDADQAVDEYAAALGVSPKLVVPDETVAQLRQQRAEQQQQQASLQMAQQGAGAVKDLAQAAGQSGVLQALAGGQAGG